MSDEPLTASLLERLVDRRQYRAERAAKLRSEGRCIQCGESARASRCERCQARHREVNQQSRARNGAPPPPRSRAFGIPSHLSRQAYIRRYYELRYAQRKADRCCPRCGEPVSVEAVHCDPCLEHLNATRPSRPSWPPLCHRWPFAARRELSAYPFLEAIDQATEGIPEQWRQDVCQDVAVAVLVGELLESDLETSIDAYTDRVFKLHPRDYGPVSLDAPRFPGSSTTVGEYIPSHALTPEQVLLAQDYDQ